MRYPDCIAKEMELLGDRLTIRKGKRHYKILVDGRLAAIFPFGGGTDRSPVGALNIRSDIRRAANGVFSRS